jgi:hypothetical protein
MFDEIRRIVQEAQGSLDYAGQLFNFLAIVVEPIDVGWGGPRPRLGPAACHRRCGF